PPAQDLALTRVEDNTQHGNEPLRKNRDTNTAALPVARCTPVQCIHPESIHRNYPLSVTSSICAISRSVSSRLIASNGYSLAPDISALANHPGRRDAASAVTGSSPGSRSGGLRTKSAKNCA